jgi:hypothetical protein
VEAAWDSGSREVSWICMRGISACTPPEKEKVLILALGGEGREIERTVEWKTTEQDMPVCARTESVLCCATIRNDTYDILDTSKLN